MEVILSEALTYEPLLSILHVCGGDPQPSEIEFYSQPVFSTYVEVILVIRSTDLGDLSILHVCGGDPDSGVNGLIAKLYSPRMWR